MLRSRGLKPVADREVPAPGGAGCIPPADMVRYVAALLRIIAGEQDSVLRPETLATMFRPHFQPDPRVPSMGLAFELGQERIRKTVAKTGIVSGSIRRLPWLPRKASVSLSSATPAASTVAALEPLHLRSFVVCSAFRSSSPHRYSPRPLRPGVKSAGGTARLGPGHQRVLERLSWALELRLWFMAAT